MSFKIMESVRKGKVKKNGFEEGWVEAMREHEVPEWYIDSLAKIGYLFPKAHAVAYVMMAFRIAWYKVHEPLAFYATFFSVRAKAFDAEYCCAGMDAVKRKIREIENNKDATAVEQNLLTTLDPETMSIFTSSKVLGYENDEILGPTGAVAIPEFNTRFTRQMLIDTQPKDFNTLVRLSGFSHGTDVWLGNARELIVSGTASVLETVGCRDDIMLYHLQGTGHQDELQDHGVRPKRQGEKKRL